MCAQTEKHLSILVAVSQITKKPASMGAVPSIPGRVSPSLIYYLWLNGNYESGFLTFLAL